MLHQRKKLTFTKVQYFLKQMEANLGVYIVRDPCTKKNYKDRIFSLVLLTYAILSSFLVFATLVITKWQLLSIIMCASIFSICIGLEISVWKLIWNKNMLNHLFKWCESLYDVNQKFDISIRSMAETHVALMQKRTLLTLKWLKRILYADALSVSLGYAFIGIFLPENIYPKLSPPLPFYLPFNEQNTWISYITTTTAQTIVSIQAAIISHFIYGVFFCIFIHIIGSLDIITDIVDKIKEDTEKSLRNKSLNLTGLYANEHSLSFEEWIKILSNMISEVNFNITSLSNLYSAFCLILEIASLGSLFIFGLTITVVRQQYFYAIGMTGSAGFLFIFCHINEIVLEKIEKIQEALYDIPWYELGCNEKKLLLIALNCDKIQQGFTAAGVHAMTIERFGIVLKAGYTNLLVLKDLVLKS